MTPAKSKKREYTLDDIATIRKVVTIKISDLTLIPKELPKHISYTALLGAVFDRALNADEGDVVALNANLIKKVAKHLSAVHQSRITKYTQAYTGIIDALLLDVSELVKDTICNTEPQSIKDIDEFNTCMAGIANVKPQAMTIYFENLFVGEQEFVKIDAPKCTTGYVVFLPSEESARRVSLMTDALIDYPSTSIDISLILSYATTKLVMGGYDDADFFDRVDIDFFDALSDGMYAAKIINYFAPMVDNEFDAMSKTFFS